MPNRLIHETSPYLLQHAENPVNWYPWGDDAFAEARASDRPVLLSVGYSACHWCHVMAHESFEDESIAALMNAYFVNVKVDREERPDVDSVYMAAVQALTGQGGWPMTVFLTPDGKPFFAGTYFPPEDGHGRPGFRRVLEVLHDKWVNDRENVTGSAVNITEHLARAAARSAPGMLEVSPELTVRAAELFEDAFDTRWGGFGGAPKFPSPSNLEFLLAHAVSGAGSEEQRAKTLEMVSHTLHQMASGGMYDQLGGGFARYSVDERWVVPHFEKMLYDNAQLARVYLHAFQVTGEARFARVVRETLDYLEREMLDPCGGFYAAQDADSEGIEGKYFLWSVEQVVELFGADAGLFNDWFGVTSAGNFRDPHHPELVGRNVLTCRADREGLAARYGLGPEQFDSAVRRLRAEAYEARALRVPPGTDDKILASWNGLALAAFAEAARVLDDASYREVAWRLADFLQREMWAQGRLLHTYKQGVAKVAGMLEDYAYVGLGLVELFKLTGEVRWIEWSREIFDEMLREFRDDEVGGFFETAVSAEKLLIRQKPFFDAATPGGNGAAAMLGLWMERYFGRHEGEVVAREVLNQVHDHLLRGYSGFGSLLLVAENLLAPPREVVVVGEPAHRHPMERALSSRFLPFAAIAPTTDGEGLRLFEGRTPPASGAVAFVCEDMVCNLPAATPEEMLAQLD